jgi:hypothetical protein
LMRGFFGWRRLTVKTASNAKKQGATRVAPLVIKSSFV